MTLTGPGGVGKTRLAVRVAAEVARSFSDGVFFVDLSAARDAADVTAAAADELGLPGGPPRAEPGWLAGQLRGRRVLLVLDTCEQVIDAVAGLSETVLHAGDGPLLLLTSRQTLDLPGEVVLRVPPLPVGDDGGDAVRLFADRAAAAVPGFTVTSDLLPRVVRLCRLLDGLPLAIELAALRLRAVSLDELLARLPGQQLLLAGGRRAATGGRLRSLAASVSWSYQLCSPAEQLLWARLSVFADGFDLAAAEAVCGGQGTLGPLVGLVDKSVVLRAAEGTGAARYRLLGAVREHGAAHVTGAAGLAARHRGHYLGLARAFAAAFAGPDEAPAAQPELVAGLARDGANLRLAFDGALAAGDGEAAADLAVAAWIGLVDDGRLTEASGWLARPPYHSNPHPERKPGSAPPPPGSLPALVRGLDEMLAALAQGSFAACAVQCGELLERLPARQRWGRGWASWAGGVAAWCAGDAAAAESRLRTGLELLQPFGEAAVAAHLEAFAWLAAASGDARRAARLHGAADRSWQRQAGRADDHVPRFGFAPLQAEREQAERRARSTLGTAGYLAEHAAGAAATTAAAACYALGRPGGPEAAAEPAPGSPTPAETGPGRWTLLTPREREVAGLIAGGLTNRDIAARLVVSKRTVDAHVEHILGKLGFSSRLQVASLAAAAGAHGESSANL